MQVDHRKENFWNWAYNHRTIDNPKYSTQTHAGYVTLTGTIIFIIATWIASHLIFSSECSLMRDSSPYFGYFIIIYLVFMIISRYTQNGSVAIYEFLWACNQALLVGAFAMIIQDSHLLRATIVVVSVDQLLWYIDIVGYLIKKRFYIGVAKYLIWPQTSRLRLMTTFHHVWYIPLVLWLTSLSVNQCGLNSQVYWLSCIMSLTLSLIGKFSAPKEVVVTGNFKGHGKKTDDEQDGKKRVYLNLNLSWELWKDVKSPFLTKCYDVIPEQLVPIALSLFWDAGSFIGFVILLFIEYLYS